MKCINCGSDFASDQIKCPYCGSINEHALRLAKELQTYDKEYEEKRDELLQTGTSKVLKKVTIGMGLIFLAITVVFAAILIIYTYRFSENSTYQVTGSRLTKNSNKIASYIENKDYIRAYELAAATDPTQEYFEYYPEYKDELTAIYNYSLILMNLIQSMEDMDNGDNYNSLTGTDLICLEIFYNSPECSVKEELALEIEQYLKNYYRLTPEEIEDFKQLDNYNDFKLDGSSDIEAITKERMVAYYGK